MKKTLMLLVSLFLLFTVCAAQAQELPQEVQSSLYGAEDARAWEVFDLPDGRRLGALLQSGSYLTCFLEADGHWSRFMDGSHFDGGEIVLQRHGTGGDPAGGEAAPGFDLVDTQCNRALSFRWNGETFAVCGWKNEQWQVTRENDTLRYVAASGGQTVDCPLASQMRNWLSNYSDVPQTPEAAQALVEISPEAVADAQPGFTLCQYEAYNGGDEAYADYARITENGRLEICHTVLMAGRGVTHTTTSLQVALSRELLERAKTTPLSELFCTDGYSDTFLTQNPLDLSQIPISGEIVQSDLQACGLILLTQDADGARHVAFVTYGEDGGYRVQTSPPLPGDVSMDIFHGGEGTLQLELDDCQAGYGLHADGLWHLEWGMLPSEMFSVQYGRVQIDSEDESQNIIGTFSGFDLLTNGVTHFPASFADLSGWVERDGWAVVNNPDPNDRLHLRAEPNRNAESMGKFWNGTPVVVLKTQGDWVQVRIGTIHALEGWMMEKYLAFGEAMDEVAYVGPNLFLQEERGGNAFADPWQTYTLSDMPLDGTETIIGACEAEGRRPASYILLSDEGLAGYAPQEWYWDGNG